MTTHALCLLDQVHHWHSLVLLLLRLVAQCLLLLIGVVLLLELLLVGVVLQIRLVLLWELHLGVVLLVLHPGLLLLLVLLLLR